MANTQNGAPSQKRALVAPPAEMGIVTPERVRHAIAHTARIQRMLDVNPEHGNRAAYEKQLEDYKTFLGGQDEETLRGYANDLIHLHDMDKDSLVGALSHLIGA